MTFEKPPVPPQETPNELKARLEKEGKKLLTVEEIEELRKIIEQVRGKGAFDKRSPGLVWKKFEEMTPEEQAEYEKDRNESIKRSKMN